MKLIALLPVLGLVGCATCEPTKIYVPKEVLVPVPVACKNPISKPEYLLDDPQVLTLPLYSKCAATLSEVEQREAYEKQLEAAFKACEN